jgi:rubrerythrin
MKFESTADLLHFAISKEQASQHFYRELASQMKDAAAQKIFQVIAQQEQRHEEVLKLELIKQGYTLAPETGSPRPADYEWQEHLELDQDALNMNYAEALLVAIQKERAAFQLYTQLITMAQAQQFRTMLLELAEEEMRHVIQFEREYDAVSH